MRKPILYKGMNEKLVGLLRLDEENILHLYAAERIETLEVALAETALRAHNAEDCLRRELKKNNDLSCQLEKFDWAAPEEN